MENNEIMERLLQDDKSTTPVEKEVANKKKSNGDASISRVRVVTAKYKVYIVLLLIFICLFLLVWIPNIQNELASNRGSYSQVNSKLNEIKRDIEIAKQDISYLCDENVWVINNETNLKECLNKRNNCSSLPDTWKVESWEDFHYDLSIPLSYLQLHSLYNKKMPVDEKRVLKNLNEYLIKQDISWWDRGRVWDILKIKIWDPKPFTKGNEHFLQVPVDVEIEFDNIGDLTGFLYNVEKKLIDKPEDRILYKIQSVSYDIVTNDEPQVTDISMIAYYYHDERFDGISECSDSTNTTNKLENTEDEISEDWNNSDSFLDWIFKKFKK